MHGWSFIQLPSPRLTFDWTMREHKLYLSTCGRPLSAVLWSLETTLMAQEKEREATYVLVKLNFSDLPDWMARRMTLEGTYMWFYVKDKMDSRTEHLDKAPGDM